MTNPIKMTFKTEVLPIILLISAFVASFYFYANFPERVPTHWNFKGQVDGWSSAAFAAFFFPVLNLGMYLLFLVIPYIDPKKERYEEFKHVFHIFKNFLIAFMTVIYFLTGLNGMGYNLPINVFVPIMVGILFILMGNYMGKLKSNWFMGARNPWTLSSEEVWNKTNRITGKIFILSGLLMILEGFLPDNVKLSFFIFIIALMVIVPNLYSFIIYNRTKK